MSARIIVGDCRDVLSTLDAESVQCCVTSPPYFGLRDYGVEGQLGLERTPDEYVERLTAALREVRRVLKSDGTLWLNLGDSYAANEGQRKATDKPGAKQSTSIGSIGAPSRSVDGLPAKNLIGIPWRVAFALQADGWYLRSDIIWAKPNPMPESVTDRPTKSHEYLFLLAKSESYFYDYDGAKEPAVKGPSGSTFNEGKTAEHQQGRASDLPRKQDGHGRRHVGFNERYDFDNPAETRNRRTVWHIATQPYSGAHFATFPPALIEPCILAGSRVGDTVLDPFGGAGTTGLVCDRLSRHALLIELNPEYAEMARKRLLDDAPLFADVSADPPTPAHA